MQGNEKGDKGQNNKFTVTVTFGGINKPLEVNRNQSMQSVIARAMELFHSPAGNLGLYLGGTELLPHQSVEQAGITPGAVLLLRPRGSGGG